ASQPVPLPRKRQPLGLLLGAGGGFLAIGVLFVALLGRGEETDAEDAPSALTGAQPEEPLPEPPLAAPAAPATKVEEPKPPEPKAETNQAAAAQEKRVTPAPAEAAKEEPAPEKKPET